MVDGGSVFSQDKIFLQGDRVREYLETGVTTAPVTLEIDLTNDCNNKCPGCAGYNSDNVTMDADFAASVIVQAADLGVRGLIFTGGGEPLMHPDLPELIELASGVGLDVGLITSGQRPKHVTDSGIESIVENTKWVRVSLDAGSPERYKEMHGLNRNGYNNALEFISDLVDARWVCDSNVTIGAGYLTGVGDPVVEGVDAHASAEECASRGVDYFQLRPMHGASRKPSVDTESLTSIVSRNKNFKVLMSSHKYDLFASDDGSGNRSYDYCHGSRFASVVTADGYLTLCCHSRNQDWGRIANLHDVSLSDAWQSQMVDDKTKSVDMKQCVPYCRCDNINRSLESMTRGYDNEHKNFL